MNQLLASALPRGERVGWEYKFMKNIGELHHIELQTQDLASSTRSFGWVLDALGYEPYREWGTGRSWRKGAIYIVLAVASNADEHDRRGAGLNHLAFHAGSRENVDSLWTEAKHHGWGPLYEDRHPWAGGPDHYAAFFENDERFNIELVADDYVR